MPPSKREIVSKLMNTHAYSAVRMTVSLSMCVLLIGCGAPQNDGEREQYTRQAVQKDYGKLQKSEDVIRKVKVLSEGEILLDDKKVSIDELRSALKVTRTESGAVWYYRESASEESSEVRMAVMEIITDEGLPTRFSSKPDFSDSVPPFENWK
jgi:hypothetical protein